MQGFKKVKAYVYGKGIITTDIAVKNGYIAEIGNGLDVTEPYPYKDGEVVLPGFIDEHIHGAAGKDGMDGTTEAIKTVSLALAKEGTTSFLVTTMTQSEENTLKAVEAVKEYKDRNTEGGADVLGVHLEGPFISEKHIGAQPLKYLKDPDPAFFEKIFAASGGLVKMVTLAPEEPRSSDLISAIKAHGAVASAGHTDAGAEDIARAMEKGLSCVTHTYNAMRPLHHRQIGTVGAALLNDGLFCEVICDLIHVSKDAVKLLAKNKPENRLILITDSMRAKWLKDGESELGGQKVFVKDGQARLADGTLAGSTLKMNNAVKNLTLECGIPFVKAVNCATVNPAENLGVTDRGIIAANKRADFTVLDGEFNVKQTIVFGNQVYIAD